METIIYDCEPGEFFIPVKPHPCEVLNVYMRLKDPVQCNGRWCCIVEIRTGIVTECMPGTKVKIVRNPFRPLDMDRSEDGAVRQTSGEES